MSHRALPSTLSMRRPTVAAALALLLALAAAVAIAPSAAAASGTPVTGSVSARDDTVGYTLTRDGWGAHVQLDLSDADYCLVRTTLEVVSGANQTVTKTCGRESADFRIAAGYGTAIRGVTLTLISGFRSASSGLKTLPEPSIIEPDASIILAAMADGRAAVDSLAGYDHSTDGCSVPPELVSLVGDLGTLSTTFYDACVVHDFGYANLGGAGIAPTDETRATVDEIFLSLMLDICDARPAADRLTCETGAYTFYSAVRIGGGEPFYS